MNKLYVLMACFALIGCLSACDSNIYNASMPMSLDIPNHVYCMIEDVDANNTEGNAFNVVETNVTIDCQGWTITGDGTGTGIYSDQNGTTVENCGIYDFYDGIVLFNNTYTKLTNISASSSTEDALTLSGASYGTFENLSLLSSARAAFSLFQQDATTPSHNTFNHLNLTGTGGAHALDMELGGNDGFNTFGNSTMTSDGGDTIHLVQANQNTFSNLTLTATGGAGSTSGIYLSGSNYNSITSSTISSSSYGIQLVSGGEGNSNNNMIANNTIISNAEFFNMIALYMETSSNNTIDNNNISMAGVAANEFDTAILLADTAPENNISNNYIYAPSAYGITLGLSDSGAFITNNTIIAGEYCFYTEGDLDTYLGNNCTSDLWVSDSSGGNTFNDSTSGNIWNFANGTPSWEAYNTSVVGAPGWATSGTLPFNATNTPTEWSGSSGDWHPWTGNEYAAPPTPPTPINVNYTNYSVPNVTGFGSAFDYSKGVMTTATGNSDAFGLMVLGTIFICFYIIGSRYTQERALVYSMFMVVVVAFLMVSGNFLDPKWLILSIVGLLASVYFAGRVSQ